ncbi:long-chain acyl-CoA synthetase [Bacillus sp. SLBN-46]|uniref:class I adenylate-forming enzyme family protein n=1 Tax=Bacillus sp. SLBN-46 TaxID=3042283 RepID=UPI00285DAB43|nr:AMP-binding protein [Bacillus sp. SLBN-46]MDR6123315.1 long-chain acyl-CoA synthetase [Bacillus sp. SLBN-46]
MVEKTHPYWPTQLPAKLTYLQGEKPLVDYLEQHAKQTPNETAYIFYGTRISWSALSNQVQRFAHYLHRMGVKKGSCVALYMQNCPQYIIAHFAIQKLGGMVVPLNPMFKENELAYFLEEAPIEGIISGSEGYPLVKKAIEKTHPLQFVVTTNYHDFLPEQPEWKFPEEFLLPKQHFTETDDFCEILQNESPYEAKEPIDLWSDVGLIVFTSGTTGRPKGAMLTYGNALFKTAASMQANGMGEKDVLLASAPLCHIAGMVMGLNSPVYTGRPCVLFTRFDPLATVEAIEKERITYWYSIAPMNWAILQLPTIKERNLSSLKKNLATSFGIQVTAELADNWRTLTNGCSLFEAAYGLSETHTCDTFMPKDKIKYGSCGIPIYETQIRILNLETGEEQPAGKEGEIVIKNPGVFKGYLNRPPATSETLQDGWVHTGDIGYLDDEGYLYFLGRVKEMIKSSGYSIFPEDVEALLNLHPAIRQSAVIGVPDPLKGEVVKAFVVLHDREKEKLTAEDLIAWAKETMAAYKYPRYIEIIDQLPATPSGKVLRKLLKEE